jgi:hypothetical protein
MKAPLKESLSGYWHRLLVALAIRNEMEWVPPGLGPEVNHPYSADDQIPWRCCHCGGGEKNPIHRKPFDPRRHAEVLQIDRERTVARAKVQDALRRMKPVKFPILIAALLLTSCVFAQVSTSGYPGSQTISPRLLILPPSVAGCVVVYPPPSGTGNGVAIAPDGTLICGPSSISQTSCLHEADDYRHTHEIKSMRVMPAPNYALHATWNINPMEGQHLYVDAAALTCDGTITGACVRLDTAELSSIEMPATQIVNLGSGPCLLVKPEGTIPDIPFGVGFGINELKLTSCNGEGIGVVFDTTNGPIYYNNFEFWEAYTRHPPAMQITASGSAPSGFTNNITKATRVGADTTGAPVVKLGTDATLNVGGNEWALKIITAQPGYPAVDTWESYGLYNLDIFAHSDPSYAVYFEPGTVANRIVPHQLLGSNVTAGGYSIGGNVSNNSIDLPVSGLGPRMTGFSPVSGVPWQNPDFQTETVIVSGGTVTDISLCTTSGNCITTGQIAGSFLLKPGMFFKVTYTGSPAFTRVL